MLEKSAYAIALLTMSVGTAHAAGGPRFDGIFVIVAYNTAACSAVSDVPGVKHRTIFRALTSGSSLTEALQINVTRGVLYVEAELDGTLAGRDQVVTGAYTVDAYRTSLPDAVFNLTFNPRVITETTESFTFGGTWKNYRAFNCVAAVRGAFKKRPPE
jgi:hypothetical protein